MHGMVCLYAFVPLCRLSFCFVSLICQFYHLLPDFPFMLVLTSSPPSLPASNRLVPLSERSLLASTSTIGPPHFLSDYFNPIIKLPINQFPIVKALFLPIFKTNLKCKIDKINKKGGYKSVDKSGDSANPSKQTLSRSPRDIRGLYLLLSLFIEFKEIEGTLKVSNTIRETLLLLPLHYCYATSTQFG
ncbi:hypothetical protein PCH_Pc22g10960 [Penicillium rubens Wisconsin 54-1255]|uniref:Uncharacterized protein n=1 Tax=Penicillium rubens (strain ATCC 28089 / DSM 1075 / NRRL 1951 / Wisconsin 54-1255) TaxID=500485 RepID=B6HVY4_PENRW|nr:hypothetical protein PCH_Pc22g10960 [Penicillium rubens Wisconsin 54-1255]